LFVILRTDPPDDVVLVVLDVVEASVEQVGCDEPVIDLLVV